MADRSVALETMCVFHANVPRGTSHVFAHFSAQENRKPVYKPKTAIWYKNAPPETHTVNVSRGTFLSNNTNLLNQNRLLCILVWPPKAV